MNTPTNITSLKPGEIFVFGGNAEGRHGKGAALTAWKKFGAIYGQAEGLMGQSYSLPTVGFGLKKMPLAQIKVHAERFIKCAEEHPELTFFLTLVACGLAGHSVKDIAPMFWNCPANVVKPVEFC